MERRWRLSKRWQWPKIIIKNRRISRFRSQSQLLQLLGFIGTTRFVHSIADFGDASDKLAIFVQKLLKFERDKPTEEIERALHLYGFELNHDSVLKFLRRHRSDWKPAFVFFNWASKESARSGYTLVFTKTSIHFESSDVYNEILDILGKTKRFEEFDKMSKRKERINEVAFRTLISQHAAAHKVDEAIDIIVQEEGVRNGA